MKEVYFDSVQKYNDYYGFETLHPLVSVVRMDKPYVQEEMTMRCGLYMIFLKENKGCKLSYGRTKYDFDEMTVTSFEPGQVIHVEQNSNIVPKWTGLIFHPDFLARTNLGKHISRYEFFSYTSSEALHLSAAEVEIFRGVLGMIQQELNHAIDKRTRELIVSNIELLLNYCLRFYDRQFITREEINHSVVQKFEQLLKEYIQTSAEKKGLPTVAYFADKCNLSTGYFGELVKTETGRTAKDFISSRILSAAKEYLSSDLMTVTQISARLGFEYPQHFVRFFKRYTGMTPSEFKKVS